jgi:hypothetical protein
MIRMFGAVLVGMIVSLSNLWALEATGKLKTVDADKGVVVLFANGQDRTLTVDPNVKILDEQGKALPDGLKSKELKPGIEVSVTVEIVDKSPILKKLQLGKLVAQGKSTVGLKPLTEMTAQDKYKGEDGGLYGGGKNEPPEAQRAAAKKETAKITPRDAEGNPSKEGKIVLISISMSNATQEFSAFKKLADADADKSPSVVVVDCAQGGQAMAEWAPPAAKPWDEAERRLKAARVSNQQVQVAWIKLANKGPRGDLAEHGKKLQQDTTAVLQNAKARFPNLRVVYLGSRIYAGYANNPLNPEPYAYESAFVVRWLIRDQIDGAAALNYGASRETVKTPLLLWGPYLWADGTTPRKGDNLIYERKDLASDGTHPSESGQQKVAGQLLKFFKTDPQARTWFVK